MDVRIAHVTLTFAEPMPMAYGMLRERELLLLRLSDSDGAVGWGEAAPLEAYDGVSLAKVRDAFEAYEAILRNGDGRPAADLLERCRIVADIPQALAAVDLALWDRAGNRENKPIAQLLAESPASEVRVNATIPAEDRAQAARQAAAAAQAGYTCVKVKVGVGDDAGRVAAVRAAVGPDVAIRIDANGAWDVDQALAALRSLAPARIELCEEPVHGVAGLAALRARLDGEIPIAMDETAREPDALASGACDLVCLKVAECGGITRLWAAADTARAAGSEVYVGSTYDGPIGIAAGLHAAAALGPDIPACGLATLSLFDGVRDPFPVGGGRIQVPRGPGLGISWPVE
jgi:o-succinylbenzoate synthase